MLKPLLRTIPNLSGNVKLACMVSNYEQLDENNYEAYVRSAKLLPISSVLNQKLINVSLTESNYANDLKKFYGAYSNYFYNSQFVVPKDDYIKYDILNNAKQRDLDFEMGCKRLSYKKLGYQFAFFAPIYLTSVEDIPDYLLLTINFNNNFFVSKKTIRINIKYNNYSQNNYLYHYVYKHANSIDSNFIYFLENTKQATYYGIDLESGSFVRKIDNVINRIFREQLTIQQFDNIVSSGWRRNKLCVKQILPLCFYFNINDFLSDIEKDNLKNTEFTISGVYYKDNKEVSFYDFDVDYANLYQRALKLNTNTARMEYTQTDVNIMGVANPSLNEGAFYKYRYANKITPSFVRWKLKYSNDVKPYILNMSVAFSRNQASTYKYGSYPEMYNTINGISNKNNNFIAPIGNLLTSETSPYYKTKVINANYQNIMNRYISTWYHTTRDTIDMYAILLHHADEVEDTKQYYSFNEDTLEYKKYDISNNNYKLKAYVHKHSEEGVWVYYKKDIFSNYYWCDVQDNKCYFGGVLYDFKNIFNELSEKPAIDKFAVFAKIHFTPIDKLKLSSIYSGKYTLTINNTHDKNCTLYKNLYKKFYLLDSAERNRSQLLTNEENAVYNSNEIINDKLFIKNDNGDAKYIDLTDYGIYYYDINCYYNTTNIIHALKIAGINNYMLVDMLETVAGYELLQVYYPNSLCCPNLNNPFQFELEKMKHKDDILNKLYISESINAAKIKYARSLCSSISKVIKQYEKTYYVEHKFVSKLNLVNTIKIYLTNNGIAINNAKLLEIEKALASLYTYTYNPIVVHNSNVVTKTCFVKNTDLLSRNYGHVIPTKDLEKDGDVLYVDQYNINHAISYYNITHDTAYSYYTYNGDSSIVWPGKVTAMNNKNSANLYAKFLNTEHFHWYINKIYTNYDNKEDVASIIDTLYLRKRIALYNYKIDDLSIKDEYIPVSVLYPHKGIKPDRQWMSKFINKFTQEFTFVSGCWYFTDNMVRSHRTSAYKEGEKDNHVNNVLFDLLHIDDVFNDLTQIPFELVYNKRFIKFNDELHTISGLGSHQDNYKDLYLYTIEQPYEFNNQCKVFVQEEQPTYVSCDISHCLKPVFNDVKLQKKESSVIYKEYEQSHVSSAYCLLDGNYTYLYRYKSDELLNPIDITEYTNNYITEKNPYIIGTDPLNGHITYNYTASYVNSYFEKTGINLIDSKYPDNRYYPGFNMIDTCSVNFMRGYNVDEKRYKYVAYSYTDYSITYIGHLISYSYYSYNRFKQLYDKSDYKNISYAINDNIVTVWNDITYAYSPTTNIYDYKVDRNYSYFDDCGLYTYYNLNTYTVPYTYTYYSLDKITVSTYVPGTDEYSSYYITKDTTVQTEHTAYAKSTYGFYMLDVCFDNTRASFKLVDENLVPKKYFTKLNGIDIYNTNERMMDLSYTFNMFLPFSKLQMFKTMSYANTLQKPLLYNIPVSYETATFLDERNNILSDITSTRGDFGKLMFERYFDAVEPILTETTALHNSYCIKFKDMNIVPEITYTNLTIYKSDTNIYNYTPIRIYHKTGNYYSDMYEIEYKHLNASKFFNLFEEFTIDGGTNLSESSLTELKSKTTCLDIFKDYMINNGKNTFTDNEILFLYNRYNVTFLVEPIGIDNYEKKKTYKLTYKFNLL